MKNETKGIAPLIIAIVVIVVVAVAGVGIFVATRGGTSGGGGGGGGGGDITGATNLSFNMTSSAGGVSSSMTFYAKDIGSTNLKMRVEGTAAGYDFKYIINGTLQKLWVYAGGMWTDMTSSLFSTYWDTYSAMFSGYQTDLAGVTGDTWTDGTTTISNISTATLADSLFADPT
ncbi:MAG: hypothetical protein MUO36_02225 [Candidatus Hadarchaeum sp.]|nr:hypothetical protein [Candidatus Hadarchaeum sp.]